MSQIFFLLIVLLLLIMLLDGMRTIETFFPQFEYNGKNKDLKVNLINSFDHKKGLVTIEDDVKSKSINTRKIRLNNDDLFSLNSNGNLEIGNQHNHISFPDNKSVIMREPTQIESEANFNNVHFLDNVYINDNIKKNKTPICFYNDEPHNCLRKHDIKHILDVDLSKLKHLNEMMRGACISLDSIKSTNGISEKEINDNPNIMNTYPLNDNMICINEQKGVNTLQRWYHNKDNHDKEEDIIPKS